MVSAAVIRSAVAAIDVCPAWGCLYWMHMKFLQPTLDLGEDGTTLTVANLEDWTKSGAQFAKGKMRAWMSAGGFMGRIGMDDEGYTLTAHALRDYARACISQQVEHVQRTGLSLGHIQDMLLEQHAANHAGLLFNFFVEEEDRLIRQYSVCDVAISLESINRLDSDQKAALEDVKRTIVKVSEKVGSDEHGQSDRTIDFYMNQGQDTNMLMAYQGVLSRSVGLSEETISSMVGLFDELPQDDGALRLSRDPSTGALSWSIGQGGELVNLHDWLMRRQANAGDSTSPEEEDTDPVDTTDGVGEMSVSNPVDTVEASPVNTADTDGDSLSHAMGVMSLNEMD